MRGRYRCRCVPGVGYLPLAHAPLVLRAELPRTDVSAGHHLEANTFLPPDVYVGGVEIKQLRFIYQNQFPVVPQCLVASFIGYRSEDPLLSRGGAKRHCSHRKQEPYVSYISANRQSFVVNVVTVPI